MSSFSSILHVLLVLLLCRIHLATGYDWEEWDYYRILGLRDTASAAIPTEATPSPVSTALPVVARACKTVYPVATVATPPTVATTSAATSGRGVLLEHTLVNHVLRVLPMDGPAQRSATARAGRPRNTKSS